MNTDFISAAPEPDPEMEIRSDCIIRYRPRTSGGLDIGLESRVMVMYGQSIHQLAEQTLTELGIAHASLHIEDYGALPFVVQARIEAAVKMAHPELEAVSLPELKDQTRQGSRRDRFRRSRLYIPGTMPKFMLNAGIHQPDAIILDLEDSVAPPEKLSARFIVRNALRTLDFFDAEPMVRINQGDLGLEDLEAVVPQPVHLVLIPKAETADQIRTVDAKIAEICKSCGREEPVFLMPILESTQGIVDAPAIARASGNNVALAIGLEDYTADLGVQRTAEGQESIFARSMVVNAARSAGLQATGTVFSDVDDMEGLRSTAMEAKSLGFDGMGAIHPRQIRVIHKAFAPTEDEIEMAKEIVLAFDEAQAKGLGVVSLGTKMIDPPVVKRAQRIVDLAVAGGSLEKDWKHLE
ncbi:MAG: HpcH/HpaI aldolase/citrate lyase family protein [Fidelibacterota bacterium]|nr:MAG: HpcH/HpaI aldolase/citrate lyase family protein [Candidatus Neomarinimicrobiota bacterium]